MRLSRMSLRVAAPVLAASLALLAFARTARAQDRSEQLGGRHRIYESPQHFAFELRFGAYKPQIDEDPALHGANPYATSFGTAPRLELAAEFDWQILRIPWVGTIGPGASIGITSASRRAHKLDQPTVLSASDQTFDIYPMYLAAVLRADVLMRKARIPLVPYLKLGIGYALWRGSTTGGTSVQPSGNQLVSAKGSSWGTHAALGLAFQLNVLDSGAGRAFDESMGVNNTYLYAEWMFSSLGNLSGTNALRVGTSTWVAGLAFEF